VSPDREELRAWYREALTRRSDELRALRDGLARGELAARDSARAVGQALRGSGDTFGFPDLSTQAALVESSADSSLARRVEGLIEHLNALTCGSTEPATRHAEWLMLAAGVAVSEPTGFADLASAWRHASAQSGVPPSQLAERAAERLGIAAGDLGQPSRAALRLVPEAMMRRELLLPLGEDAETIRVAAADPTSLATELELIRLTGREPLFTVAPPEALEHAMAALLGLAPVEPARSRRALAVEKGGAEGGADRVLVVDDDGSSRLLARAVLEKHGYAVAEAEDGEEALDRLRSVRPIALVVADLNMPVMDGLELLWEIRADADLSHVPVIVLTGETDETLETKLIEEGADDYVCKPLDPRLFLARVGATIRRADSRAGV